MRVGLVIYGSLDILSGGYLYDRKLVEYLRSQGDRVKIVSLPWRNYTAHLLDNFNTRLRKNLHALAVDVFLQDELNHPSLFWLNRWFNGQTRRPVFSIVHHLRSSEPRPAWHNSLYRQVERTYLESVDGFVYNSQTTRQVVEGLVRKRPPAVVAYPAGDRLEPQVTDEEIVARARKPPPLRIFFLGNLTHRKGLHVLLDALALLPASTWVLTVGGSLDFDRQYARKIFGQVDHLALSGRVRFLGPLDEPRLISCFRHHQVLALPSFYEGFGIAYLEGMGFGLPAIATTAGAAAEIITPGIDGYLVPPGNVQALAGCLNQLGSDRDQLLSMSLAARQRYLRHPTWEQTCAKIRKFLQNV